MNKLNEEILAKFLMGECTEDELREVNAWLEESGENARELFRLEEIYHLGRLGGYFEYTRHRKGRKAIV